MRNLFVHQSELNHGERHKGDSVLQLITDGTTDLASGRSIFASTREDCKSSYREGKML